MKSRCVERVVAPCCEASERSVPRGARDGVTLANPTQKYCLDYKLRFILATVAQVGVALANPTFNSIVLKKN